MQKSASFPFLFIMHKSARLKHPLFFLKNCNIDYNICIIDYNFIIFSN